MHLLMNYASMGERIRKNCTFPGGNGLPPNTWFLRVTPVFIQTTCRSGHSFCRAMLCIRDTSHDPVSVRLSVRLSVTSRSSTKTAKRRITQTTPHDSPGIPVFWRQRSLRNSTGVTSYEGAECRWGGSKSATFDK